MNYLFCGKEKAFSDESHSQKNHCLKFRKKIKVKGCNLHLFWQKISPAFAQGFTPSLLATR
jgi:hypothetical protein